MKTVELRWRWKTNESHIRWKKIVIHHYNNISLVELIYLSARPMYIPYSKARQIESVVLVGLYRNTINKMKECCRQLPFPSKRTSFHNVRLSLGLLYLNPNTNPTNFFSGSSTTKQIHTETNARFFLTFENLMNPPRPSLSRKALNCIYDMK